MPLLPAAHGKDVYKADHRRQYPDNTELVFSNWTGRKSRVPGLEHTVHFGLQYYILEYLIHQWNETFFKLPKRQVVDRYARRLKNMGIDITIEHMEALHDLGYIPVEIWSLPEGTVVPNGVPSYVLWNTIPEFFWVTNYLETSLSNTVWGPTNSATIAMEYRDILTKYVRLAGGNEAMIQWQGHDFSCRGMFGMEAAAMSGAGHLLSFTGTDTIEAIDFLEMYYLADSDKELIGGSVPATEHSVMCMGSQEREIDTYRRLLTEIYPSGIVSVVSDTWDYWGVWTDILPQLKSIILARLGTLVIRPDSGDPVKVLVGDSEAIEGSPEYKGSVEVAWDLFGGTINDKGFKVLDSHIGLIYGDSITWDRARRICEGLIKKGFAPTCILGIGSYTYQYNTRDTFGFAMKATAGMVKGEMREIFKNPKTDDGTKRSAKGLLAVNYGIDGKLTLKQQATWEEVKNCAFVQVFKDGVNTRAFSLSEIRATLKAQKSC